MRVLVACEESQAVTAAFRARGHEAYSCDIQHCALWNHMEWHIVEDARELINGNCTFQTVSGGVHTIDGPWDLLIAHPPCTYITSAGATLMFNKEHQVIDRQREKKMYEAVAFFRVFLNADCRRIAVENPAPLHHAGLPPYTQIIEPYMFGEPWKKRTCLWLKNLPKLEPTNIVTPLACWVHSYGGYTCRTKLHTPGIIGKRSPKERSKTFPGVAQAMAEQWG